MSPADPKSGSPPPSQGSPGEGDKSRYDDPAPHPILDYPIPTMGMNGKAIVVFQWFNDTGWVAVSVLGALRSLDVNSQSRLTQPGDYEGHRIIVGYAPHDTPIQ